MGRRFQRPIRFPAFLLTQSVHVMQARAIEEKEREVL